MSTASNPLALVTGASRGIGAAIAAEFKDNGWDVIGTSTSGQAADGLELKDCWAVDFADPDSTAAFCEKVTALPRLDALVNNAGINIIKPIDQVEADDFTRMSNINLRGPYLVCQAAFEVMAKTGGGRIVNIASIWASITKAQRSLYSAAKTGLVGMTRTLAVEGAPQGILVNALSPGFIETDMTRTTLTAEQREQLAAQVPIQRMAQPEEIAPVVAFLCSTKNTYLTGQNITVDGGFTIV